MLKENQIGRRAFLSKSFKAVVSASMAIVATKVVAYDVELGQDSTDVTPLPGGGKNVPHSSRGWR
jgi:hypothetical protein